MKSRRKFLYLATGAAAFLAFSRLARAQSYPARPVHLLVGFFAGGLTDILARVLSEPLSRAPARSSRLRMCRAPAPMWRPKKSYDRLRMGTRC